MTQRTDKINELIKQELAFLLLESFPGEIIEINRVETASDLSESKVFVGQQNPEIRTALKQKSFQFRKELAAKLYLRHLPKIIFVFDDYGADERRIEEILSGATSQE